MKEIFSYTKFFTILLSIFYIFGLLSSFYEKEILISVISFAILCILILFFNLGFKKSIILFLIFTLGLIKAKNSLVLPNILDNIFSNNAKIYGQIISSKDVSVQNNKIKFYLRADNADISGKFYENINTKFLISIDNLNNLEKEIHIGDYINLTGKLRHPSPASNPHQFDYQKYLLYQDVSNILYADTFEKVKSIENCTKKKDKWYLILNKFEKTRNKIIEKHSKNIKSPNLEILGGIVFGNETINPDEEIKENFKNSGLLHLLAASGLNVALIYGIWWWIASLIRFPYNLSILIGAVFVILYTFMTGFPPSILRASIMLLFVLFGKIIDRNANSLALIFFVGLLLLLINPKMLFDIGFQLSFVVTIGLVSLCPMLISKFDKLDEKYKEKYKNASRFKKYLFSLFCPTSLASVVIVPLVAQMCVIPLQIHYFNNFAPFSLLANIAVIPFIGILSFIGFASSIFALIPFANTTIIYIFDLIANPMLTLLVNISKFFSSFKISLISTYGNSVFQIFIFWSIFLLVCLNLKHNFKNKNYLKYLFVVLLIFISTFIKFDFNKNQLEIIMFDVGNADSFLIKTPQKKYIMIDTGKKSYKGTSSAQIIINKYLKNEKIPFLEKLIVTHFDSDHCSGVIDIVKNTKTKEVIIPNEKAKSEISDQIINFLKSGGANYSLVKNDFEIYKEKDLSIKTYFANLKDENESSIVTLVSYKNKNILFMGDVSSVGYEKIKQNFDKINILKVGHHGAKNSLNKNMLTSLKPEYALISAGFSKFNHPHFSTLKLLNQNKVNILSTKSHGFCKIILKDNQEKIYYFDKKLIPLTFIKNSNSFHESKYFKSLIKKYETNEPKGKT